MNPSITPTPATGNNKTLWAAIGVLGVAVLAMGATLIRIQSQPIEPRTAVLAPAGQNVVSAATAQASAPVAAVVPPATEPMATTSTHSQTSVPKAKVITANTPQAKVKHAQAATTSVATEVFEPSASPKAVYPQNPEPAVARPPVRLACSDCGTVESVNPIEVEGTGSGTGAIAGGVLGAVVGNQVGDGTGKALATILGAVGGGMAGNAVEKKMKKITQYEVSVRMEDGSHRIVRQTTPASVGSQVTVAGNTLQAR